MTEVSGTIAKARRQSSAYTSPLGKGMLARLSSGSMRDAIGEESAMKERFKELFGSAKVLGVRIS